MAEEILPLRIQILRRLNPVLTCVLKSRAHGIASKHLLVLQYRGRKTGALYAIPLVYVTHANQTYCVTRNTQWWKSAVDAPSVTLWLRGVGLTARAERAASAAAETRAVFVKFLTENPGTASLVYHTQIGPDGRPDAGDVEREIHNASVIRFSVVSTTPSN